MENEACNENWWLCYMNSYINLYMNLYVDPMKNKLFDDLWHIWEKLDSKVPSEPLVNLRWTSHSHNFDIEEFKNLLFNNSKQMITIRESHILSEIEC